MLRLCCCKMVVVATARNMKSRCGWVWWWRLRVMVNWFDWRFWLASASIIVNNNLIGATWKNEYVKESNPDFYVKEPNCYTSKGGHFSLARIVRNHSNICIWHIWGQNWLETCYNISKLQKDAFLFQSIKKFFIYSESKSTRFKSTNVDPKRKFLRNFFKP